MPQNTYGVLNTANTTWLTTDNPNPLYCGFGNVSDAVLFSEANAVQKAIDLNTAYGVDTYIGHNPHPR